MNSELNETVLSDWSAVLGDPQRQGLFVAISSPKKRVKLISKIDVLRSFLNNKK